MLIILVILFIISHLFLYSLLILLYYKISNSRNNQKNDIKKIYLDIIIQLLHLIYYIRSTIIYNITR
jgi:heme/copper-type cytochrome/quinol oxidase subunit 3